MATFEPTINPVNPPDFGSKSRPVDLAQGIRPEGVANNTILPHGVMQGDESAKYAGEATAASIKADSVQEGAYGDLFKNIVGTADFLGKAGVIMVKKDIEDKVYEVADRERQSYTDLLEKIKSGTGVRNILDANAQALDDGTESSPAEVENLPDTLGGLKSAADSGKISGTYYQSRLLAEAKNLRAQYPGFREEIDQAFAKVTGSVPANAYIRSLVQDINRGAASASGEMNRMLSFVQSHIKYPGAEDMAKKILNNEATRADVIHWAAPYANQDYTLQLRDALHKDDKNTREDNQRIAGQNFDYLAGVVANRATDSVMSAMGINSKDDLNRVTSLQQAGQISEQTWTQWGQQAATIEKQLRARMIADADAHGYTKDLGGKAEVLKRVDDAMNTFHQSVVDRIYNHDFGGVYSAKRQFEAINDDTKVKLMQDPKIGPYVQQLSAMKDIGGEQNVQQFALNTIKGDFNENFKAYFDRVQKEYATQVNMKTLGQPYTFNDTIDNLKKNKVTDGRFNQAILNEVTKIYDPNIPEAVRRNYALAAFSTGNLGMISRLQEDKQSPVFQKFTAPEMTKAMYELGQKDPIIWKQYTDWAKSTLTNEVIPQELKGLENAGGTYDPVKIGYDPKNHRFTTEFISGSLNTPSYGDKGVIASVNRINSAIYNYMNIAKQTGEDPDAFILSTIASGAGKEALQNVTGIPYQMMRQLGLSRLNLMQNGTR